jgi:histidinol-phosphate aminotransferase
MPDVTEKNSLFKPYLIPSNLYVGGKSKDDVDAGGKKIHKLSSNENPLGASPKALEAIRKHIDSIGEYPDNTDHRLRQALQTFYENELSAEQFITGCSGSEVLEMIIRAFLDSDSEYIVCNPMFKPYQMFSDKMGAKMVDVPLLSPDFDLDVDALLEAITEKTRLIFLTSPNNPTGTYIPKAQLERVVNALPNHVVLVLDEVYYLFADAADYSTALPFVIRGKQVIGLNSFSKSFGMAGMRIGYAYTTPELARYIQCLYKPFMHNRLSMEGALAALEDHDFLKEVIQLIRTERQYLYGELDKLGVHYWKSQGNFILFIPKKNMTELECEAALLKEGVMVRPAGGFGAPGCVRVTIGTREANEAFIAGLRAIML